MAPLVAQRRVRAGFVLGAEPSAGTLAVRDPTTAAAMDPGVVVIGECVGAERSGWSVAERELGRRWQVYSRSPVGRDNGVSGPLKRYRRSHRLALET